MFNTYANEDYDRRNEEVDPVASSAEYELEKRVEKLELFPVELEKGGARHMTRTYGHSFTGSLVHEFHPLLCLLMNEC